MNSLEKINTSNPGPGPGAYKIPVKVADVPKYILPNKSDEFRFV